MKFLMMIIAVVGLSVPAFSQDRKVEETTFGVKGVCGMCKERIEHAVAVKGVKRAEWDRVKNELTVIYNPKLITLEEIHQHVADAGHDTDKITATDEAYSKVHKCCKYREMEVH